jgi:hypothetical protein
MPQRSTSLLMALALALLAGCAAPAVTGSAQFAVAVPQALSASVSRVSITAIAADFPSVSVELAFSNGSWGGTLGNLPAGPNRTFLAQAFDASGTLLFEGSASGVSVTANQTTLVAITLQQVNAPPPFENEAPIIDSLTAPATSLTVDSSLSLVAAVHDPNPSDTLTYTWSSTAGSFSSASEASTSWTAPSTPGFQTLTFTVTDSQGLASSLALTVYVTPAAVPGNSAQLSISFNSFPQVAALSASLTRLAVGQTTAVSASASDLDSDSLTYSWSASCSGSWSNASSPSAGFTPDALPAGLCNNCRLTVSVSDGRGGQTTGSVNLCISGPAEAQHFSPVILSASGSSGIASPGEVLTYEVEASDPEGSALSFSWTAAAGALGAPSSTASTSRITWTAPVCLRASARPHLTVTVTNAFGLAATKSFEVTGLQPCGWAPTGSMVSPRSGHTATLLNDGKVLVAGGSNGGLSATAELYDPATGTWSATGSMRSPRGDHTATLLNTGKVLVVGGEGGNQGMSAELYDPATGTWSATDSMRSLRFLASATLLPNGKVLVSGGDSTGRTAEVYDPATGTWSATGSMISPRNSHTATLLNDGKVLVAGGCCGPIAGAELYDPATGTWSQTGALASARFVHTATLLPNGQVLVTGGVGPGSDATEEVYDPVTGSWSPAGVMASPRIFHTATLLPDGRVLVAGGFSDTTELYDPATGTWSTDESATPSRWNHTATLLNNGKVLVAGGGDSSTASGAVLYTP